MRHSSDTYCINSPSSRINEERNSNQDFCFLSDKQFSYKITAACFLSREEKLKTLSFNLFEINSVEDRLSN